MGSGLKNNQSLNRERKMDQGNINTLNNKKYQYKYWWYALLLWED